MQFCLISPCNRYLKLDENGKGFTGSDILTLLFIELFCVSLYDIYRELTQNKETQNNKKGKCKQIRKLEDSTPLCRRNKLYYVSVN